MSTFFSEQCKDRKCLQSGEHGVSHDAASRFPSKPDFRRLLSSRAPSPGEVQPLSASFLFSPLLAQASHPSPKGQALHFLSVLWKILFSLCRFYVLSFLEDIFIQYMIPV